MGCFFYDQMFLEMENAPLKRLKALIQQEEARRTGQVQVINELRATGLKREVGDRCHRVPPFRGETLSLNDDGSGKPGDHRLFDVR